MQCFTTIIKNGIWHRVIVMVKIAGIFHSVYCPARYTIRYTIARSDRTSSDRCRRTGVVAEVGDCATDWHLVAMITEHACKIYIDVVDCDPGRTMSGPSTMRPASAALRLS